MILPVRSGPLARYCATSSCSCAVAGSIPSISPMGVDAADWMIALNDFSQRYQPTVDRTPTATQLRLDKGYIASGPHHGSDVAGSWSH